MISETTLARVLSQLLEAVLENKEAYNHLDEDGAELADALRFTRSYEEAGMLTRDAGFVVYLQDGTEFQVTVLQRR